MTKPRLRWPPGVSQAKQAAFHRDMRLLEGKCQICGERPFRPGKRSCEGCAQRDSTHQKAPHRRGSGGACVDRPGECSRCTQPPVRGGLCAAHVATMEELKNEREAG